MKEKNTETFIPGLFMLKSTKCLTMLSCHVTRLFGISDSLVVTGVAIEGSVISIQLDTIKLLHE